MYLNDLLRCDLFFHHKYETHNINFVRRALECFAFYPLRAISIFNMQLYYQFLG